MRRRLILSAMLCVVACNDPSDVLYTAPLVYPVEVEPGLFRVTNDTLPDYVRGFTATGDTILFRSLRTTARGDAWEILGFPAAGGLGTQERASLYRLALTRPLATIVSRANDRFLVWWQAGNDRLFYGPAGCPAPPTRVLLAWRFAILRLEAKDGAALSSIPTWSVLTPWGETTTDNAAILRFRMRWDFGQVEAEQGANAFGPAIAPDGSVGLYSDGEAIWRFHPGDPAMPPDSIGPGIFPGYSADGTLLSVVLPQGIDSAVIHTNGSTGLRQCLQDEWTLTATSWTTAIVRLATGDTVAKIAGTEPAWDPSGTRVIVRRSTGLVWVELASKAETAVPSTEGAFGAAISPDGQYLAFSKGSKNVDVYFVRLK